MGNPSRNVSNKNFPSHVHVFKMPNTSFQELPAKCRCQDEDWGACSSAATFTAKPPLFEGFRTASLNWTAGMVAIALDGVVVSGLPIICVPVALRADC